jgi:hypothetical protein
MSAQTAGIKGGSRPRTMSVGETRSCCFEALDGALREQAGNMEI